MSSPARSLITALAVSLTLPALTASGATLTSARGKVVEASHRRDIALHAHWAEIVDTHVFAAAKSEKGAVTAVYSFSLPKTAAVIGLTTIEKSRRTRASAIDAEAALAHLPNTTGLDPDLALLRELSEDETSTQYQIVLHPVTAAAPLKIEIRWVMPTSLEASLVTARIPTRGDNPALRGTALFAKVVASEGALKDFRINGKPVSRGEQSFDQDKPAIVAQARLDVRGGKTKLRYFTTSLGGNLWALTIAAASPSLIASRERFANLAIVVDTSRSMSDAGLAAARRMVAELLEAAAGSHVEVVVYNRRSRGLLGGLRKNTPKTRTTIDKALGEVKLANGSNLKGALHAASSLLAGKDARRRAADKTDATARKSAIVVLSDGQAPIDADADALRAALGDAMTDEAIIFAIDIASGTNPLPSPPGGALSDLVLRTGGRSFSMRASSVSGLASEVARQLGPAPQLGRLSVEAGGKPLHGLALPPNLAAGSGFLRSTVWAGSRPPRTLVLRGVRSGEPETAKTSAKKGPGNQIGASLALRALDSTDVEELSDGIALVDDRGDPLTPSRAITVAGNRVPLANQYLSLVVPNTTSRFARERLAFAKKWGTELYLRAPSADERHYLDLDPRTRKTKAGASKTSGPRRLLRGGGLDRSTIGRAIRGQLFRPVRHCYETALRKNRETEGTARVRFEISRSEVRAVAITSAPGLSSKLQSCIVDAAFELNMPVAANDEDTTYIVNYPFRLRRSKKGGSVDRGSDAIDPTDPLDGL